MSEGPRASLREHLRALAAPQDHVARPPQPARRWAIVACMDARFPVERILGLAVGDAHVVRNAGAVVTDDVLRSLVISCHLLGTREFAVIGHTGCGLLGLDEQVARQRIAAATGGSVPDLELLAFSSLRESVGDRVRLIARHRSLPPDLEVTGLVYDDHTGRLEEVTAERTAPASPVRGSG